MKRRVFWALLLCPLLLIDFMFGPCAAQTQTPSKTPLFEPWQTVSKARVVLYATLVACPDTLPDFNKSLSLTVRPVRALKGTLPPTETLTVDVYLGRTAPEKSLRVLQDLKNRSVLVFVSPIHWPPKKDGEAAKIVTYDGAVLAASPADADAVRAEVKNQAAIKTAFPKSRFAKPDKWDKSVKSGLDHLVRDAIIDETLWDKPNETPFDDAEKRTQALVFQMELWDTRAVPALVRHLGDRRSIGHFLIGSTAPPDAWESRYYYKPEKVINVLDSLLRVLTRADITPEFIGSGGSEADYQSVTQAWQVYVWYTENAKTVGKP